MHERALRSVYPDCSYNFDELLIKNGSFSIYDKNIPTLATKIYKFFHGLFPSIIKKICQVNTNTPYSVRSGNEHY